LRLLCVGQVSETCNTPPPPLPAGAARWPAFMRTHDQQTLASFVHALQGAPYLPAPRAAQRRLALCANLPLLGPRAPSPAPPPLSVVILCCSKACWLLKRACVACLRLAPKRRRGAAPRTAPRLSLFCFAAPVLRFPLGISSHSSLCPKLVNLHRLSPGPNRWASPPGLGSKGAAGPSAAGYGRPSALARLLRRSLAAAPLITARPHRRAQLSTNTTPHKPKSNWLLRKEESVICASLRGAGSKPVTLLLVTQ
jgi:hypothetical protein